MQIPKFSLRDIYSQHNQILVHLFLILLVTIPLLVITTFALHSLNTEVLIEKQRARETQDWILKTIKDELKNAIETRLSHYFSDLNAALLANSNLRNWTFIYPDIDLVAVFSLEGEQSFPAKDQNAMVNEIRLSQRIQPEVISMFKQGTLAKGHRAFINSGSGPDLFACNMLNQQIACLLLNATAVIQLIDENLKNISMPEPIQVSILIPGVKTPIGNAPIDKTNKLSSVAKRSAMGGQFFQWQVLLYGTYRDSRTNQTLLFTALLLPVFFLLLFCGYGLYRMEKLNTENVRKQKQFSAELAHEIRTPLTNLRLYIDLIKQTPKEEQAHYCHVLSAEIERLSLLVDNAILLAKPEQRLSKSNLELAEPDEVIQTTLTTMAPLLEKHSCKITCQLRIGHTLYFDQDALQRVLFNLLDNSRKYANGSTIDIASHRAERNIVIDLKDNGPGLPSLVWHKVKETDGMRINLGGKGFGLGLRVCIRLCQRSGGQLEYLGTRKGVHYRITLPVIAMTKESKYAYPGC